MAKRSPAQGKPPDLEAICRRVREKSKSYDRYNFSSKYNDFLKAFFDLAQEYDSLDPGNRIPGQDQRRPSGSHCTCC